jgi:hypothetical protein
MSVPIDLRRYVRVKPEGLVTVGMRDDSYALLFKRFDVERGTELKPEAQKFTLEELTERKDELVAELSAIEEVLAAVKEL